MNTLIRFGETVEGYAIPVLNEREIRAAAGILFLGAFLSLMLILFRGDFLLAKYFIMAFLADFIIRVFINPAFAPSLIIGRLIVRNQVPEYVGAQQKKFAWVIGLVLSATMFVLLVVVNAYSPITGISCLICLVFLFFESAFGICLGCILYRMIYGEKAQYCPGEVCAVNARQAIQQTSAAQLFVVLGFVVGLVLAVVLFGDQFRKQPYDMFGINRTASAK